MKGAVSILVLVYGVGILLLHTVPLPEIEGVVRDLGAMRTSHLFHLMMFLPWGYLGLCFVYRFPSGRVLRGAAWIALGVVAAVVAEGAQYFVSYRSFNFTDLSFNIGGVLLGAIALVILRPRREAPVPRSRDRGRTRVNRRAEQA
jgi:glycopeptide antibiotics resistance protein